MATGTIVDIVNRALGSIGARAQVQNLNEGSTESNAANVFFTPTFESLARSARWNCLRKQASLTLVAAAPGTPENPQGANTPYPPNPWYYSYLVPPDSLFIRQLIPPPSTLSNSSGAPVFPVNNYTPYYPRAQRAIPYEVAYGVDQFGNAAQVVNTGLSQAQAIYTVNQPNPQFWDSLFQQAMVASLAAYFVPALTLDKALMQMQIGIADRLIAQARAMDGNEGTVSQDRTADWIAARNGESGPWGVGFNTPWLNYEAMPWPLA